MIPNSIEGVQIGKLGDFRAPVTRELNEKYGVTVQARYVHNWRSGRKRPVFTEGRVRASIKLEANDAFKKDYVYLDIATSGVRQRKSRETESIQLEDNVFLSEGFTINLAVASQMHPDVVRKAIRTMRAEIVFDPQQLTENHKQIFVQIGETYISHFQLPHMSSEVENYISLDANWNRTIPSFYEWLYSMSARVIGGWTPYEVTFLRFFYQDRIARGSHLSALDKEVLESYRDGLNLTDLAKRIRGEIKTEVDRTILTQHRNLLLEGAPVNRSLSRK